MSESFAELLQGSRIENMHPGSVINGVVTDIEQKLVTIDVNLKSEGRVPIDQFTDNQGDLEVKIGDEVEVVLEAIENGYGQIKLSREKAKLNISWKKIEEAYNDDNVVQGRLVDRVKGGYVVLLEGVRAFLPGSLLDASMVNRRNATAAESNAEVRMSLQQLDPMDFHIIKMNRRQGNVVVSRRALGEVGKSQEELMADLVEGSVVKGMIKNLTEYGAFVDIGGLDGLLHVTDMAWRRVRNPSEVVNIGDSMEVKILKIDRERSRISLGIKQLREDPWTTLGNRYPAGTPFKGKVTNIVDYGCFVELEEGVEGLVHITEMDWVRKNVHPNKLVDVGDEVDVKVLDISEEKRRISLSMKQCVSNPWEQFESSYEKGCRLQGTLKALTEFGLFFGLEGGVDGLVHVSDLSWDESAGEELLRSYESRKGESMELVFLGIDPARERISLGLKQLTEDLFSQWCSANPKGNKVQCVVAEVEPALVRVELESEDNIKGVINASELSLDEKVDDARTAVGQGDKLQARITGFDRKKRLVQLSVRAMEAAEQKQAVREYNAAEETENVAKLGDVMSQELNQDRNNTDAEGKD